MPTVAASVDLVVHIGFEQSGARRVEEIVAVPGRLENDIIETEPLFGMRQGRMQRLSGSPPRATRFERVGIDLDRLLHASGGRVGEDGSG